MKLTTAFQKIVKAHGDLTYATVKHASGNGYERRLDLELSIHIRDEYELIGVRGGKLPPSELSYKVSDLYPLMPDNSIIQYTIYRDCKAEYYVTVYNHYQYDDFDWEETFKETKYPSRTDVPWWVKKELN